MKLRKSKLIALGLAGLMCVSPLSSMAYAEELLLDDGELIEEFVEEEVKDETPAAEEQIVEEVVQNAQEPATEEVGVVDDGSTSGELEVEDDVDEVGAFVWSDDCDPPHFVYPVGSDVVDENGELIDGASDNYTSPSGHWDDVFKPEDDPYCVFEIYDAETDTWKPEKVKGQKSTKGEVKAATCDKNAGYYWEATLSIGEEKKGAVSQFIVTDFATRHLLEDEATVLANYPDGNWGDEYCTQPYFQLKFRKCIYCGKSGADFIKPNSVGWSEEGFSYEWKDVAEGSVDEDLLELSDWNWVEGDTHNYGTATKTYYILGNNVQGNMEKPVKSSNVGEPGLVALLADWGYDDGKNVDLYENTPIISNDQYTGSYRVVEKKTCKRCKKDNWDFKRNTVTEDVIFYIASSVHQKYAVERGENILYIEDTDENGNSRVTENGIDEKYIALIDCNKEGTYFLVTRGQDSNGYWNDISRKPITVKATAKNPHHHTYIAGVQFNSAADAGRAIVTWKNGNPTVKNTDCTKELKYNIIYACDNPDAAKCGLKRQTFKNFFKTGNSEASTEPVEQYYKSESATADDSTNHVVDAKIYTTILEYARKGYSVSVEDRNVDGHFYPGLLKDYEFDDTKDIKLVNKTYSCNKAGTVDVEFYCTKCHKLVDTVTIGVTAPSHIKLDPAKENEVAPTCSADGSYETVVYCKRCKEELEERKTIAINRLPHSYEVNSYTDHGIYNGGWRDNEGNVHYDLAPMKDVTPGFEFVGNVVVDYSGALLNRVGKTVPGEWYARRSPISDVSVCAEVFATCSVCGQKSNAGAEEAYGVFSGENDVKVEMKVVDIKAQGKVCQPGKITLSATATYRDKDGKEQTMTLDPKEFDYYTSETAYTARTAHNWGEKQIENQQPDGSYDEVWYCTICGEEVKREHHQGEEPTPGSDLPKTVIWQLKDEGEGTMLVRWRTGDGIDEKVDGYRFAYATDENFSDAKYSAVASGLNHGRRYGLEAATYYVKVQTYKLDENGKRIYSGWSSAKSIAVTRRLNKPASAKVSASKKGSAIVEVTPTTPADGYQVEFTTADGTKKTTSGFSTKFTRNIGKGTFTVKVRAFKEVDDGRYYSGWVDAGTITL